MDSQCLGTLIKWNPAIKTRLDRESLMAGLLNDKLDVIAIRRLPGQVEPEIVHLEGDID